MFCRISPDDRRLFRHAFTSSIPVMMGYLAMGFAAGVLLAMQGHTGCPAFWGALSAASCVSGTIQFLIPEWFRNGTPYWNVLLLTLCINFRYAMYGFSLLEKWKSAGWKRKSYLIWTLTDETYALECSAPYTGPQLLRYCTVLSALDHAYWILGVTAGAVTGSHLPFSGEGIDFAMTALFLVILTDQCQERFNRRPALIGAVSAFLALALFGADRMLIPAIVLMLAVFLAGRRRWEAVHD